MLKALPHSEYAGIYRSTSTLSLVQVSVIRKDGAVDPVVGFNKPFTGIGTKQDYFGLTSGGIGSG